MRQFTISTGRSRTETEWKRRTISWEQLTGRLSDFRRTSETFAEYQAMSRTEKGRIKDVGGFVGGAMEGGQRKASAMVSRSLLTLDIDYGRADTLESILLSLYGTAWCLYSTHSSTEQSPRYRLILPLSRDVTPDEYVPVARRVASLVDMEIFDDSTYQPERLMYWPSCSADAEPVFRCGEGEPVDVDSVLASFADWRNAMEWPVSSRVLTLTASRGGQQEDPTLKGGLIGAFCRAYTVPEAISAFLADVYAPTGQPDRYTYISGTTEGGAVVYEDKWLYSHHGTDPCCEREVNAFDLVRLHLFGDADAEVQPDTPVNRLPSFSLMSDLVMKDDRVKVVRSRDNIAAAQKEFEEIATGLSDEELLRKLEWKQRKGRPDMLENTPRNFRLVLENHSAFKGAFVTDDFTHSRVLTRDVLWHKVSEGRYWTDADDRNLLQFFADAPFYTQGKQNIIDTALFVAERNHVHPVREYLNSLVWDGKPRLDTLIIDYLGAADNELNRAMTRKHLCAACRRIFEPGCKHDGVLALDGPQGIGKSTLIKTLGGPWFSDTSISVEKANETGMQLQGTWLLELAELTDYKRSTTEMYKNFISSQEDKIRVPYDRSYQVFPRQCVIFASTNDRNFLKGDTGNRRFWIIPVWENPNPAKNVWRDLPAERDQIWAEAMAMYRDETSELGPLEAELYRRQAGHNEMADDIRVEKIRQFMLERVPRGWSQLSRADRREWAECRTVHGIGVPDGELEQRPPVCYLELAQECLGTRLDTYTQKTLRSLLSYVGAEMVGPRRDVIYGNQRRWKYAEDDLPE